MTTYKHSFVSMLNCLYRFVFCELVSAKNNNKIKDKIPMRYLFNDWIQQ